MTQEVLKLALEALERSVATCFDQYAHRQVMSQPDHFINQAITAIKEALAQEQECWCTTCRPITMADMRFVVCPDCDNKRCPKANDHRNACTNSNEVGQKGSSWEHVKPLAQPEQDHIPDARKMVTEQEPVAYWKEHAQGLQRDYDSLLADFQAQQEERNFCQRCGKRTKDIHTCTPPQPYE